MRNVRRLEEFFEGQPKQRSLEFDSQHVKKGIRLGSLQSKGVKYKIRSENDSGLIFAIALYATCAVAVVALTKNDDSVIVGKCDSGPVASLLEHVNFGIGLSIFGFQLYANVSLAIGVVFLAVLRSLMGYGGQAQLLSGFLTLIVALDSFLMNSFAESQAFAVQALICVISLKLIVIHAMGDGNNVMLVIACLLTAVLVVQRIEFMSLYLPILCVFGRMCRSWKDGVFGAIGIVASLSLVLGWDHTIGLPKLSNDVTTHDVLSALLRTESNGWIVFSVLVIPVMTAFNKCGGGVTSFACGIVLALIVLVKPPVCSECDLVISPVAVIRILLASAAGFIACHQDKKLQACAFIVAAICYALACWFFSSYLILDM